MVFINHVLTTQAEKQGCCALWTHCVHIHCAPCTPACGSNAFPHAEKPPPKMQHVLNGAFLYAEHEMVWWPWHVSFFSRFLSEDCGLWEDFLNIYWTGSKPILNLNDENGQTLTSPKLPKTLCLKAADGRRSWLHYMLWSSEDNPFVTVPPLSSVLVLSEILLQLMMKHLVDFFYD